ncbi:MAG: ribonuclease P protein component [Candidatus Obscuribacterales bacterium]|nr:ribonuclease P protein component [Candidatus Obscuribacterales bacterium]
MLPDPERLRKTGLFQRVYSARKSVSTELLSLYVLPKQTRANARLPLAGFVVGKKTLAKACDRNRAKRRLREAYKAVRSPVAYERDGSQNSSEQLKLGQWYAIVWVVQAKLLEAEYSDILDSVRKCLQKASQKFGEKRASS